MTGVPLLAPPSDGAGRRTFARAQLDALFAAVLIDDEVDAQTDVPERITLDYTREQLVECFRISRQLWTDGAQRELLTELVERLARNRDLDALDRVRFKHVRAKLKHLRFACSLYSSDHRYPFVLDRMTVALGSLQDAFKGGRRGAVRRDAALCRLLLTRLPQRQLEREISRLDYTSSAGFRAFVVGEVGGLWRAIGQPRVTGAQFHDTRKVVSRQVAFYDTLRTLEPGEEAYRMSRALAALNGLMGAMHDRLVERRAAGTQDYHRHAFVLPDEIRARLSALLSRYAQSAAGW